MVSCTCSCPIINSRESRMDHNREAKVDELDSSVVLKSIVESSRQSPCPDDHMDIEKIVRRDLEMKKRISRCPLSTWCSPAHDETRRVVRLKGQISSRQGHRSRHSSARIIKKRSQSNKELISGPRHQHQSRASHDIITPHSIGIILALSLFLHTSRCGQATAAGASSSKSSSPPSSYDFTLTPHWRTHAPIHPPCVFNPGCTCSKQGGPDLGEVTCAGNTLADVPSELNNTVLYKLKLVGNGLRVFDENRLHGTGNKIKCLSWKYN